MQPSSLIFVAVIGIWAAFLVQHWVRRREDLATARSLDRFSDAMRVLERRPVISAPTPRPSLALREAAEGHDSTTASVVSARSALTARPVVSAPASPLIARSSQRPSGSVQARIDSVTAAPGGHPSARPERTAPSAHRRPARGSGRRPISRRAMLLRRAWALLGVLALVAVPVTSVLALTDVIARWLPLLPIAALVLAVGALRMAAVRERTSRHTGAQLARARSASASSSAATPTRPSARVSRSAVSAVAEAPAADSVATPVPEMPDTQGVPDEYERVAPSAPQIAPARPAVVAFADFGVDPATLELSHAGLGMPWSPVAVPPPTYTLKDKAPALPPVVSAEPTSTDAVSASDEGSSIDVPVRRAVGD